MNKRKEYEIICLAIGKEIKYEILTIESKPGGWEGRVYEIPQPKSCLEYQCSYRDTQNCPLWTPNK